MECCDLDINNKWELRQVEETRGEDGESMRQMIVMAAARNGYSDAYDPDKMRWWIINETGRWKATKASEQLARFNDRVSSEIATSSEGV